MKIANEQYKRRLYKVAEITLNKINKQHVDYLSNTERNKLEALTKNIGVAMTERGKITRILMASDHLAEQNQFAQAAGRLEMIKGSEFLSESESKQINDSITYLQDKQSAFQSKESRLKMVFETSVRNYEVGNVEKAKQGFAQVAASGIEITQAGKTANDYISLIEQDRQQITTSQIPSVPPFEEGIEGILDEIELAEPKMIIQEPTEPKIIIQEPTEPQLDSQPQNVYIRQITRKKAIIRARTNAVVIDALSKAQSYLDSNEFAKAKEYLAKAFSSINTEKHILGDALYSQHHNQLRSLDQQVDARQNQYNANLQVQKLQAAAKAREDLRKSVDSQRSQAVAGYLKRATNFMDQMRYEEALGQLEQLLAIEKTNPQAISLKKVLENTLTYRKQLEIQKMVDKEEIKTLLDATEALTPYSELIQYYGTEVPAPPKNWYELVKQREQEYESSKSPEEEALNKQLNSRVDLSAFTEDMTFAEAIDILRNSVDPQLSIIVIWSDLSENAFIERDQAIQISGMGLSSVRLRTGLDRLLQAVGGGFTELGYSIGDGIVTVATEEYLPTNYVKNISDVGELLSAPAMGQSMMGGGSPYMMSMFRGYQLSYIIQETIEPDSWFDAGGEGKVNIFNTNQLIVWQTPEVHEQIDLFLKEMTAQLGQQVAIEARFLVVSEHFLEDIGVDTNISINLGSHFNDGSPLMGVGDNLNITTDSYGGVVPTKTSVAGSLGGNTNTALGLDFTYSGILDDLSVNFIIRATQMHKDSKVLTAPRIMVMNNETGTMNIIKNQNYIEDVELITDTATAGENTVVNTAYWDRTIENIPTGVRLSVTPTITTDKKYVILNISAYRNELLALEPLIAKAAFEGEIVENTFEVPTTEFTIVTTRVMIPDRSTILLGGQTVAGETQLESGVPILKSIPFIGRLFTNKSEVKDKQVLLILVKPTILLKNEQEQAATAALRQ